MPALEQLTPALAALAIALLSRTARADGLEYFANALVENGTSKQADGYHIEIRTTSPVDVIDQFECGAACGASVTFRKATVKHLAPNDVALDYSGATVAPGQSALVGTRVRIASAATSPAQCIDLDSGGSGAWWAVLLAAVAAAIATVGRKRLRPTPRTPRT